MIGTENQALQLAPSRLQEGCRSVGIGKGWFQGARRRAGGYVGHEGKHTAEPEELQI